MSLHHISETEQGIHLAATSRQEVTCHTDALTQHLVNLGFQINVEKSMMTPVQCIAFIGFTLDSVQARTFLSLEKVCAQM